MMDTTLDLSIVDVHGASPPDHKALNSEAISIQELLDRFITAEEPITPQNYNPKPEEASLSSAKSAKNIRIRISKGPCLKENGPVTEKGSSPLSKAARIGIVNYQGRTRSEKDLGSEKGHAVPSMNFLGNAVKLMKRDKDETPLMSPINEISKPQKGFLTVKRPLRSATQNFEIKKRILLPRIYHDMTTKGTEETCIMTASIAAMLQEKHEDIFEQNQALEKKSTERMGQRKLFMPIQGQLLKISTTKPAPMKNSGFLCAQIGRPSTWIAPLSFSKNSSIISIRNFEKINESKDLKGDKTFEKSFTSRRATVRKEEEELE